MYITCSTLYLNRQNCFMFRIRRTYPSTYLLPSSIRLQNVTDVPLRFEVLPFEKTSVNHITFLPNFP